MNRHPIEHVTDGPLSLFATPSWSVSVRRRCRRPRRAGARKGDLQRGSVNLAAE